MVQTPNRPAIQPTAQEFPSPMAYPVFYRTYSRRFNGKRETWVDVCERTVSDIALLGQMTPEEKALVDQMQRRMQALMSGRALWVMGTDWIHNPANVSGAYNCTSTNVLDWRSFGLMMDLAMMGCGTGGILEPKYIEQLPVICNRIEVIMSGELGTFPLGSRQEQTTVVIREGDPQTVVITVGDSRQGWVKSYQSLLELSSDPQFTGAVTVRVDMSHVRPAGEALKGFGGVANPVKLPGLYERCAAILNKAVGRKLTSVECCLLIDEAAATVVAGNIRRSAGMRQFDSADELGATAKDNLWQQDESGNWRIDPERDALRMANHTRVFHHKPTLDECIAAVQKQFYSGEGAIQYAPEAIARANADILRDPQEKRAFIHAYIAQQGREFLAHKLPTISPQELDHRLGRYGLNPCGEIVGADFHCVSGETILITRDGMHPIKNLVGKSVEIWNGQRWSQVTPFLTGQNRQLYRVRFGDGTFLDVTEKHRFFAKHRFGQNYEELTTLELTEKIKTSPYKLHTEPFKIIYDTGKFVEPIWAYTLGQLVGDGSICQSNGKPQLQLRLYGHKSHQELAIVGRTTGERRYYTESRDTPCILYTGFQNDFDPGHVRALKDTAKAFELIASWDRESILSFIAGLADADGSEVTSGGIRIYISDYDRAYRVYLLLLKCGIHSSVNLLQKADTKTNLGVRKKDLWYVQITDCTAIPCQRLNTSQGHLPKAKGKNQIVQSVELLPGQHNTYCFNEPEFHKGVFGGTLTGQCNLAEVHLNQIDPQEHDTQKQAFQAASYSVAALLNHRFQEPRYQFSRAVDPIVGVSFTGLFDFFVHAFGVEWLQWWQAGRPNTPTGLAFKQQEQTYLTTWRDIVHESVWDYCDRHGLRRPNRCTTVQPAGTKSLLTGASPGWHPPKAQRFIRRITFAKGDPVALACLDFGYSVVPAQSDKDEQGQLLTDPFDPRCTEWLVEIPVEVSWANLPGASEIPIEHFSALAQFDFYMQVQNHYTTHNTSATIELREDEITDLGKAIFTAIDQDLGYMSAALLARFDAPFPRLPFEKIDQTTYQRLSQEVLQRRRQSDFLTALMSHDTQRSLTAEGPAGCDAMGCLMPETTPESPIN